VCGAYSTAEIAVPWRTPPLGQAGGQDDAANIAIFFMERTTPNVRISPRAHELLRQLAEEEQQSMQSILDLALERYRRERFLRAANADFAALKGDTKAWKQDLGERELWEQTVADGTQHFC